MCGIYGCISVDAASKVLEGLRKLEYRGYDSAGLAAIFSDDDVQIETERTIGYVSDLVTKANGRFEGARISIGHTRWATHGGVTDDNAHPHTSEDGKITIVHNGIIENAVDLSSRVSRLGYKLSSETDTEVIVHLLDHELKTQPDSSSFLDAFTEVISKLEGSWAIAAIATGLDGILVSRQGAPLVIGRGEGNISISSDVQPFYGACSEVAYMKDGDNFLLDRNGIHSLIDSETPEFEVLEGVYDEEDPGNFPHMMMKEIHDQPTSLSNVMSGRISADGLSAELSGFSLSPVEIRQLDRINIVACGTAYYASEIISSYIRKFTSVRSEAFIASEFPAKSVCSPNTLTIGVSQSGETKDTLDALFDAKKFGSHISSICNVIGSTMARFTGNGAYLHAGPEFAVASTKVFSNMVAAGLLFALTISNISDGEKKAIVQELRKIPSTVSSQILDLDDSINQATKLILDSSPPIFIGRGGLSSYIAKEGALKMMEISYIPCLSLPGGELKHGPIALLSDGSPVIAVVPSDSKLNLMESSIRECKTRGAKIILITDNEGPLTELADILIQTPSTHPDLSPFVNIIPIQLLAYQVGVAKGVNVDRPRNLAKSVTVV
ncbi:MAG: glutamine--fructose-6-phosphate transaminase (isomerizing) [Candidatus Thalassarchaeaceae archaeon]|jgi:glucosamine--fructose-6-phosphate aminotransferase (isomerizing)|nr:glutamine--fructose-6-phosphate transaminase (isomerizing) [Candidatus Thalassarchaeaceae archaeon]